MSMAKPQQTQTGLLLIDTPFFCMTQLQPRRLYKGFALGNIHSSRGINWLMLAEELKGLIPIRRVSHLCKMVHRWGRSRTIRGLGWAGLVWSGKKHAPRSRETWTTFKSLTALTPSTHFMSNIYSEWSSYIFCNFSLRKIAFAFHTASNSKISSTSSSESRNIYHTFQRHT